MDNSGDGRLLGEVANYLYGDEWQAQLAEQLSTRPPERPKSGIAPSLVREWTSRQARPPLWVMGAMAQFVIEGIEDEGVRASQLKMYLSQLNAAIKKAAEEGWDGRDGLRVSIVSPEDSLKSEMIASQSEEAVPIGPGVTATWEVPLAKAFGIPDVIDITLTLAAGVSTEIVAKLIAEWIMDKFSSRSEKVVFNSRVSNRRESRFDRGELTKIVEETIAEETITHERR